MKTLAFIASLAVGILLPTAMACVWLFLIHVDPPPARWRGLAVTGVVVVHVIAGLFGMGTVLYKYLFIVRSRELVALRANFQAGDLEAPFAGRSYPLPSCQSEVLVLRLTPFGSKVAMMRSTGILCTVGIRTTENPEQEHLLYCSYYSYNASIRIRRLEDSLRAFCARMEVRLVVERPKSRVEIHGDDLDQIAKRFKY